MLTKRAQLLFDKDLWQRLSELAKAKKTSVGNLVRMAVEDKYIKDERARIRAKAIESTLQNRLHFKGKIDYKELINYGRKY